MSSHYTADRRLFSIERVVTMTHHVCITDARYWPEKTKIFLRYLLGRFSFKKTAKTDLSSETAYLFCEVRIITCDVYPEYAPQIATVNSVRIIARL